MAPFEMRVSLFSRMANRYPFRAMQRTKMPRDPNQLAKAVVDLAMAAGIADHVWTCEEIAALLD